MARRLCRTVRLIATGLVAVMVTASTAAAAGRPSTPDQCRREAHHCGQSSLISCCCGGQDGSTPSTTQPSGRTLLTGPDLTRQVVVGSLTTMLPDGAGVSASVLRLHSPPHGLRFVDLPILLSTFLI